MTRREAVEAALAAWRAAERRQAVAADGDREAALNEVDRQRTEFQQLSSDDTPRPTRFGELTSFSLGDAASPERRGRAL